MLRPGFPVWAPITGSPGRSHATRRQSRAGDPRGWEARHHQRMIRVLERGYTAEYQAMFVDVEPELTRREGSFVADILEMFTTLERSVNEIGDEERASLGDHAGHALIFRKFDFNDSLEGRLASYARVPGQHRPLAVDGEALRRRARARQLPQADVADLTANAVGVATIWDQKLRSYGGPNSYLFSADELREVLAAWPYPRGGLLPPQVSASVVSGWPT